MQVRLKQVLLHVQIEFVNTTSSYVSKKNWVKMLNLANNKKLFFWTGIIILILVLFGNSGMRSVIIRKIELSKLNKQLAELESQNRELRKRLYSFENNPAFLEREARKQLGLIQPGEIKYKFIEQENK